MKIRMILLLLLAGIRLSVAQDNPLHEVSIYVGGGLSTLQHSYSIDVQETAGIGENAGIGYSYFFTPQWGIHTGTEVIFYNSKSVINTLNDRYQLSTPSGFPVSSRFYLEARYQNLKEVQKATYLNIPLMAQFQTSGKNRFYILTGLKIGIPLSASYELSSQLTAKGYSDYTGQYYENMPSHGFSAFFADDVSGSLELGIAYIGAIEMGMKWRLNNRLSLYTSVYADYGLNDIKSNTTLQPIANYNPSSPANYQWNSLSNAQINNEVMVSKITPLSFGLTVGIGLAFPRNKPAIVENEHVSSFNEMQITQIQPEQEPDTPLGNPMEEEMLDPLEVYRLSYQQDLSILTKRIGNYNLGGSNLNEEQRILLDEKVTVLKQYPELSIMIKGHICDLEAEGELNIRTGQLRAEKAKEYLVAKGILAVRISISNEKDCCPIIPNDNETARKKNRRIEFEVK